MRNKKPLIVVLGEPNSVFIEILSKVLNKNSITNKIKYPIILVGSKKLLISQLKILKRRIKFNIINNYSSDTKLINSNIYLFDINYNFKKPFENISKKSQEYISKSFYQGIKFLNSGFADIIVNGPISKKHFLQKKYPGITEYIFKKSKKKNLKNPVMLIFNKKLSVSPITTHIPVKKINKMIEKKTIINNITAISNFYKSKLNKKPKIAILGLNPHCETSSKFSEEKKIIIPAITILKRKGLVVDGPFPADTFFEKKNISKYDSVIGMYHDQVLTPFKTLFGFDASNITLGLPFLRMSVDHGPNENMLGKNISNTKSLENIFNFINSIKWKLFQKNHLGKTFF